MPRFISIGITLIYIGFQAALFEAPKSQIDIRENATRGAPC